MRACACVHTARQCNKGVAPTAENVHAMMQQGLGADKLAAAVHG
jgi:hypothetical protein